MESFREQPCCDVGDNFGEAPPTFSYSLQGVDTPVPFLQYMVQVRKELERDVRFSIEGVFFQPAKSFSVTS